MNRFAGSDNVAAAAAQLLQAPTAVTPSEGDRAINRGGNADGSQRFAGDRGIQLEQERQIEQFREMHANLRSKGLSEEAAQQTAMDYLQSGEQPQASRRYELLAG